MDHPSIASIEFDVHVRPGASRARIDGSHDGVLAVRVSAPATEGRANEAVCEVLAASFGVRRSAVSITRGHTGRRKHVCIDGDPTALSSMLRTFLSDR